MDERGRVAAYRGDELVVSLQYEGLVSGTLREWQAEPGPAQTSEALGLALVPVNAANAVRFLQTHREKLLADTRRAIELDGIAEPSALDTLHRCLRSELRSTYAGWAPAMAKNRILGRVEGTSVIDLGSAPGTPSGGAEPGQPTTPSRYEPRPVAPGDASRVGPSGAARALPRRPSAPGTGVRIGLVDTKLVADPWLIGAFETDADAVWEPGADLAEAATHHATFVAGLLLKQAPGAHIIHRDAFGQDTTTDSWQLAGTIASLARAGAQVLNLSLGCATDDGQPPLVLQAALAALGPDVVVVASAGNVHPGDNAGRTHPIFPAALENVVGVGGLDDLSIAPFSPGRSDPWVDAFARGVDVVSTFGSQPAHGPGLYRWAGTSFSAAIVSGAIARRFSQGHPGGTPAGAWAQLRDGSTEWVCGRPVVAEQVPKGWPT